MYSNIKANGMRHVILEMNPLQLSLLVAIPFVLVFSLINFTQGLHSLAQIELTMAVTLAALYGWTRQANVPFWQQNIFIVHPAILFSLLFLQGGYSELGFIWSFGFPFIACLSAGSRIGLIWTATYALIIVALSTVLGAMAWQELVYIGLAYLAFSFIAAYTISWREKNEQNNQYRLFETAGRLKQEELALADSKISHRALLDALPHALAVHSEGRWIYCNPAAAQLLGADEAIEVIGTSIFDCVHDDDQERVKERIDHMTESSRPAPVVEERLLRKNGEVFLARVQSSPVQHEGAPAFMVTAEDVSERQQQDADHQQLKMQGEHSQRLESLGVLAGGIAHDFNNLLAAISGNAELAKASLDAAAPASAHIDNIVEASDHAAELCKQMLAYAGKGSYELNVLNLNDMVKSMGKLIRASVHSNITLKMKLAKDLPGIEGDTAQIQQLLLNFIVNSADAIANDIGEIKVSTGTRQLDRTLLDKLYNGSQLPSGQYIVIEVRDNGCGMSAEMQSKIFDPFFTTKTSGSGLGLSAVLGIVRGHQGAIQVFSTPAEGTAFRVYLPSTEQAFKEANISTIEVEAWQGHGMVLVVDDDLRVRNVARSFVEKMHFDVLTADDGKEGVAAYRQHHASLVAVLLDMSMPVLGGVEAMAGMRKIDASVPIILVSGYSEVEAGTLITGDRPDAFLQKPFKAKELKAILYEVMHATI